MDAGDPDVVKMLDGIAHQFGGDDGFFGDRDVAGASRDHGDGSLAMFREVFVQDDGAGQFAVFSLANLFADGAELFECGAGGEDISAVQREFPKDASDLGRSFAFAEDDFRHASAEGAVMIDLREIEVFERHMAKACDGLVGQKLLLANLLEEIANGFGIQ